MLKKLPALCALITTACATWQTQNAPAPRVVEEAGAPGESHVRVELNSGQRHEIYNAAVVRDSIIGSSQPRAGPSDKRIAVATSDVKSIERPKFSAGVTLLTLAVIGGVILAIAAVSFQNGTY